MLQHTDLPDYLLEDRLRKWARWARFGRISGRCLSIEWQWDSAMWNGWRDKFAQGEVSVAEAVQIEKIVCYIGRQDAMAKTMLVAHYVSMANPRATVRRLKIRITDYDAVLQAARGRVANCLQNVDEAVINRTYRESELCADRQVSASVVGISRIEP